MHAQPRFRVQIYILLLDMCAPRCENRGCCSHRPQPTLPCWPPALAHLLQQGTVACAPPLPAHSARWLVGFLKKKSYFSYFKETTSQRAELAATLRFPTVKRRKRWKHLASLAPSPTSRRASECRVPPLPPKHHNDPRRCCRSFRVTVPTPHCVGAGAKVPATQWTPRDEQTYAML